MLCRCVAILVLAAASAWSRNGIKLLKAASNHFEIYTTESESSAKAAVEHFEIVRAYLLRSCHIRDPFFRPIQVIAGLGGFNSMSPDRIAVAGLKRDLLERGVQRYADLLLERSSPNLPYWLRLGLSQLYSTLRTQKDRVIIGVSPMRAYRAANTFNLDMGLLLSLQPGPQSDDWGNKAAEQFYANSNSDRMRLQLFEDYPRAAWMLTHMLMFKKEYSAKFGTFTEAIARGEKSAMVFAEVYGVSLDGLRQDLAVYMKLSAHVVVSIPFSSAPAEISMRLLPASESALVLADFKAKK